MKTHGENTIELLNSRVDKFYNFELGFVDSRKVIEFKAMLISFINQLERVYKGTYGKAFKLDNDDFELFKEMNPLIYEIATSEMGDAGINKLSMILQSFRNINAHAFVNCDYAKEIDARYILKKLPNYSETVIYYDEDGMPTLAGMITLLMFLSNDKAISYFIKSNIWNGFIDQLNYFGDGIKPDIYCFPEEVMKASKINDEIDIRKPQKSNNLIEVLFGRFSSKVKKCDDNEYTYENGDEFEDTTYHVSFSLRRNGQPYILCIKKKSNYGLYFSKDYTLSIFDVEGFIELCELLPPFMLVPYLYRKLINNFNTNTVSEEEKKLLLKLNKPKFYVDKNIDSLMLSKSSSDIRMGGQIVSVGTNYALYMFEMVSFKRKEMGYGRYSSLTDALRINHLSENLCNRLVTIRNFFSHHYIIGDEHSVGRGCEKITLEFIIKTFKDFSNELMEYDSFKSNNVLNDFYYRVICNLIMFKYADGIKKSWNFMKDPTDESFNIISKTMDRIMNSFFTKEIEEMCISFFGKKRIKLFQQEFDYLNEVYIKSDKPILLKNGLVVSGPIRLIDIDEIKPKKFISADSLLKESNQQIGLIKKTVWRIE